MSHLTTRYLIATEHSGKAVFQTLTLENQFLIVKSLRYHFYTKISTYMQVNLLKMDYISIANGGCLFFFFFLVCHVSHKCAANRCDWPPCCFLLFHVTVVTFVFLLLPSLFQCRLMFGRCLNGHRWKTLQATSGMSYHRFGVSTQVFPSLPFGAEDDKCS